MTSVQVLLRDLALTGIRLHAAGEQLWIESRPNALTAALRERIATILREPEADATREIGALLGGPSGVARGLAVRPNLSVHEGAVMRSSRPFLVKRTMDMASLAHMQGEALRTLFRQTLGTDPRAGSAAYMRRRLAWHVQAEHEGGLPESARQHALAIVAGTVSARRARRPGVVTSSVRIDSEHDARTPMPGTLLLKEYRGRRILVRVLAGGFEWEGRCYGSLSAVARAVTGTKWNGYAFFGLAKEAAHGAK